MGMISIKNDIVPALPVELIIEVLSHLPFLDAWKLQLVGKRWRRVLSTDRVLLAALTRWETHASTDDTRRRSTPQQKARHMQAMRVGRAFTTAVFRIAVKPHGARLMLQHDRTVALSAKCFAYLAESSFDQDEQLVVVDLISGQEMTFRGVAREGIMGLALSSTLVAWITYTGRLYVKDLRHPAQEERRVTLPSANVGAFGADGELVALTMPLRGGTHFILAIYDLNNDSLKSWELRVPKIQIGKYEEFLLPGPLLLHTENGTIDIFSQLAIPTTPFGDKEDLYVQHTRYSLVGEQISTSSWQRLSSPRPHGERNAQLQLGDVHPTGYPGEYFIRSQLVPDRHFNGLDYEPPALLKFDSIRATLMEHSFVGEHNRFQINELCRYSSIALWKDIEYRMVDNEIVVSTETLPKDWEISGRYRYRHHMGRASNHETSSILVNDNFVLIYEQRHGDKPKGPQGIVVYCFDEEMKWMGSDTTLCDLRFQTKSFPYQ